MSHPFDILSIANRPGRLIFTPCPGTKDSSIDSALSTLKLPTSVNLKIEPYEEQYELKEPV